MAVNRAGRGLCYRRHYLFPGTGEEAFSSDLLSRHPDCLALPMHEEYVRLYDAHGEEKAEALSS